MYVVYRKADNKYLGTIVDCRSATEAKRKAGYEYDCECYVSEIEEQNENKKERVDSTRESCYTHES